MMKKSVALYLGLALVAAILALVGCPSTGNSLKNAAAPVITAQPESAAYKVGDTASLTVTAEAPDGGVLSYQWFAHAGDAEQAIPDATERVYNPPTGEVGTKVYHVLVTNTNNGVSGLKTAAATSATAEITVSQDTTWTAEANGANNTATSTAIAFLFTEAVEDLTAEDITLANGSGIVVKGALSGSGKDWSLAVTVEQAGDLTVSIARTGVAGGPKTVAVYKVGEIVTLSYTAVADGEADKTTSTSIALSFSGAVTGLTAADITVTNSTGEVTLGALEGSGQDWTLKLTAVTTAGDVTVSISKDGIQDEVKTVAVYKAPVLTADIEFAGKTYSSGTEFDLDAWTGQETAAQSWTLTAQEQGTVYFAVTKDAAQTITVGGTDAAKVTKAESGSVGGISASTTLPVFTVDTQALVFEGGTRSFTLTVTEDGALSKTVTVTLNVTPNLTGAALFTVADEGGVETLTRVDTGTPVHFTELLAALEWVDHNAEDDTEYLVRVENDEINLPLIVLVFYNDASSRYASNVTLRLRGKDSPRTLKHGGTANVSYNSSLLSSVPTSSSATGFINIYLNTTFNNPATFVLDSNITVDGGGAMNSNYNALIKIGRNATLVLKPGSVITNYYSTSTNVGCCPVYLPAGTSKNPTNVQHGSVRVEGGSITNCSFEVNLGANGLIKFQTSPPNQYVIPGSFYKAAGVSLILSGNTEDVVRFSITSQNMYASLDTSSEISLPPEAQ
jgi:hypothetical protein